jgi:UDP-N-acetylglucosamine acyltransferase
MTDTIHPSAIVDPRAHLADGVTVGAFSVIGPEVRLGTRVNVGHHVVLESRVIVDDGAVIGHGSVLGGAPQDLKFTPGTSSGVLIGASTVIREYVTIHRAATPEGWTRIGADCLLMAMCHVAHDCRLEDGVIIINYAGITGHCVIGARATIGGHSGMVPFSRVGTHAYVGGFAKLLADVPPFVIVDGAPARAHGINVIGLRRAGMPPEQRRRLQDAYRLLYRNGLGLREAIDRIRQELPGGEPIDTLVEFLAASRRGICRPSRASASGEGDPVGASEPEAVS